MFPTTASAQPTDNNLYLFSPIDNYWPSEYYANGTRLPFTCAFIVQISPTQIQVHEYQPPVLAGKRWTIGHSGPGHYLDIRRVEPTIDDRNNLLHEFRRILGP